MSNSDIPPKLSVQALPLTVQMSRALKDNNYSEVFNVVSQAETQERSGMILASDLATYTRIYRLLQIENKPAEARQIFETAAGLRKSATDWVQPQPNAAASSPAPITGESKSLDAIPGVTEPAKK